MPYVPTAIRTGFRVLSAVAPPLAVHLGARAFWRVGPPAAVRPADSAVHDAAERTTLALGGERICVYRWGDMAAPAVLLAHGWQSRASRLAGLVVALQAAGFRVVAFDGVAHGDSTGRRMSAIDHVAAMRAVQDLDGPFAAVVGHSLGGLAAGLALHDGLAAERFVTLATPTGFDPLAESFLRLAGMPARLHEPFCEHVARTFPGHVPNIRVRVDLLTHPVPAHVPTLFVQDAEDRMALPDDARRLHAAHPASELLTTRGLGHNRILDDDAVLEAIVAHVSAPLPAAVKQ